MTTQATVRTEESYLLPPSKIYTISVSQTGFVFDSQNGHSFSVNETGLDILNALREGKDFAAIKQMLLLNYDVQPETVDSTFNCFLKQLSRHLS